MSEQRYRRWCLARAEQAAIMAVALLDDLSDLLHFAQQPSIREDVVLAYKMVESVPGLIAREAEDE